MGNWERTDLKQVFGVVFRTAKLKKPIKVTSRAVHACNPSTQEAEAGESWGFLLAFIVLLAGS